MDETDTSMIRSWGFLGSTACCTLRCTTLRAMASFQEAIGTVRDLDSLAIEISHPFLNHGIGLS